MAFSISRYLSASTTSSIQAVFQDSLKIRKLNFRSITTVKYSENPSAAEFRSQPIVAEHLNPRYVNMNLLQSYNKKRHLVDSRVPSCGFDFRVCYVDTRPDCVGLPVIVCLPGVAGTHEEFMEIVGFLDGLGARVICLNYGENVFTTTPWYHKLSQSTEERTAFLQDFFNVLGIKNVDMMICHSLGAYSGVQIAITNGLPVKSYAFMSPVHVGIHKIFRPKWLWAFFDRLMQPRKSAILEVITNKAGALLTVAFSSLAVGKLNMDAPCMFTCVYRGAENYVENMRQVSARRIPRLHMFGCKDGLVPTHQSALMDEILEIGQNCKFVFDHNAKLKNAEQIRVKCDDFALSAAFENGSHTLYKQYPEEVHNLLLQLYQHITSQSNDGVRGG